MRWLTLLMRRLLSRKLQLFVRRIPNSLRDAPRKLNARSLRKRGLSGGETQQSR